MNKLREIYKAKEKWNYEVRVEFVDGDVSHERVAWVRNNIKGLCDVISHYGMGSQDITYGFKHKEDAVAFKMRWG